MYLCLSRTSSLTVFVSVKKQHLRSDTTGTLVHFDGRRTRKRREETQTCEGAALDEFQIPTATECSSMYVYVADVLQPCVH